MNQGDEAIDLFKKHLLFGGARVQTQMSTLMKDISAT